MIVNISAMFVLNDYPDVLAVTRGSSDHRSLTVRRIIIIFSCVQLTCIFHEATTSYDLSCYWICVHLFILIILAGIGLIDIRHRF